MIEYKKMLVSCFGFDLVNLPHGNCVFVFVRVQSGPDLTAEETWGVNYRALQDLFQISKSRANIIEYDIGVQMIEIYNEQVRDLLVVDGSSRRYPFIPLLKLGYFSLIKHQQLTSLN